MTNQKHKYCTFILFFTVIILFIKPASLYAQGAGDKNDNKELSYFSQDEMEIVLGDKERPWNYGRITIAPFYLLALGDFSTVLPYATGFVLSFDHGIHHAFKPVYRRKSPLIPGLRVELAYNSYGGVPVSGLSVSGGLLWLFPIAHGKGGDIQLSSTFGMNFMRGQVGNYFFTNDAMYLTASLGYALSFSNVFFSLQGRFSYIFDSSHPWMGVGGLLGIGYKFPSAKAGEKNK